MVGIQCLSKDNGLINTFVIFFYKLENIYTFMLK